MHHTVQAIVFSILAGGAICPALLAAEIDESKLPAPATAQVDFARDIKPIFDTSCVRCHGPERPKSRFRLDNRADALKGGENGVDIVPGNSAKSPLIHYVARLVPDLEMPPPGKGEPLTTGQVALLRAWIDQGAVWETAAPTNLIDVIFTPAIGWTIVNGDKKQFREHYWRPDGFDGGLERLELFQQIDSNTKALLDAYILRNDFKMSLELDRHELGFVRAGVQQYRKYYDDTGGYNPFAATPPQSLGRDLHLDIGKAWIDFGLTKPHWPRMVLGYEYDYRRGEEATTSWGSDGTADPRNITPTSKRIDEGTHVIKFDFDADIKGVTVEDRFRGEFYTLNTHYTNVAARASVSQDVRDSDHYFQGANSIRLEKKLKEWLLASGGYFYSKLNADDSFSNDTINNNTLYQAAVPSIERTRETHMFNVSGLLGPFDGLTVSLGVQDEWTRQHSFGAGNLHGIAFTRPPSFNLLVNPAVLESDYDRNTISGIAGVRYAKIPFTSLFVDTRIRAESIEQSESDIQPGQSFLENPSFTSTMADVRAGFHTAPWHNMSLTAHYRFYDNESHYKTNQVPQPVGGYPGFLKWRDLLTHEVETKLVFVPQKWLKTTLTYQFITTDYKQDTHPAFDPLTATIFSPGGHILAGESTINIFSLGAVLNPWRRFSLSGTFSYQDSRTVTASGGLIPPYRGGVYSTLLGATYFLNEGTDLSVNYGMSIADYSRDISTLSIEQPPPLGIHYQQHAARVTLSRRITKNLTTRLQYGFYHYDEPTAAGVNNYDAHTIIASLTYHFH